MATPNLGIPHISASQSQKEVTANTAFDELDEAVAGELIHNMASDANYTLDATNPANEDQNYVIRITDSGVVLTTTRDIYFPASKPQAHVCINETAQTLNFGVSGSTLVSITAGSKKIIYIDSADDAEEISSAAGSVAFTSLTDTPANFTSSGGYLTKVNSGETALEFVATPIDLGIYISGKPTNGQEVLRFIATRAFTLPASLTGSNAGARVASTGSVAFSLKKNGGADFGTITFNVSAAGTFAAASSTSFAEDDVLTVIAPATADSTLEDIGIALKGTVD
jgi:hypothetical protein